MKWFFNLSKRAQITITVSLLVIGFTCSMFALDSGNALLITIGVIAWIGFIAFLFMFDRAEKKRKEEEQKQQSSTLQQSRSAQSAKATTTPTVTIRKPPETIRAEYLILNETPNSSAREIFWKDGLFGFPYPQITTIVKNDETYDVLVNSTNIGNISTADTEEIEANYNRISKIKVFVDHDRYDRESPYTPYLVIEYFTEEAMLKHPKYSYKPRGQRVFSKRNPVFLNEYVVIDTETTGVKGTEIDILEVSALHIKDGEIIDKFSELCYSNKINAESFAINGISSKMLEGARKVSDVLDSFAEFIGELPLLGHNIDFDLSLICAIHPLSNAFEDTMILADEFLYISKEGPISLTDRKLPTICEAFGIEQDNAHRALSDCMATYQCYEKMKPYIFNLIYDKKNGLYIKNSCSSAYLLEKTDIDAAIAIYEKLAADNVENAEPYTRLIIIYKKLHRKDDAIRIAELAISVFSDMEDISQSDRDYKLRYFYERLDKLKNPPSRKSSTPKTS